MTKLDIIKEIGLDDYYGEKQAKATKRMMAHSKEFLNQALETWRRCLENGTQTREFIGRVLTGIFKNSLPINKIK